MTHINETERALARNLLNRLISECDELQALTKNRLNLLASELNATPGFVAKCALCQHHTLVMPYNTTTEIYECRFCFAGFAKSHYASIYDAMVIFPLSSNNSAAHMAIGECPSCFNHSVVIGISILNRPKVNQLCTVCLRDFPDRAFSRCEGCGSILATNTFCRRCHEELSRTEDDPR